MGEKFTKGPWSITEWDNSFAIFNDHIHSIARVNKWIHHSDEVPKANAHLIAAAPDMFEALRFIVEREDLSFAECSVAEEIWNKAKAALSKARGENGN